MQSKLTPYLNFRNTTKEAMAFYKSVFGGRVELRTFSEDHASADPSEDDLIMHSVIYADNGISFMAADTPTRMQYTPGNNMSLCLGGDDDAELSSYFDKLAEGGKVTMPLEKAAWGDKFGMVTDKFGVQWLVNISDKK